MTRKRLLRPRGERQLNPPFNSGKRRAACLAGSLLLGALGLPAGAYAAQDPVPGAPPTPVTVPAATAGQPAAPAVTGIGGSTAAVAVPSPEIPDAATAAESVSVSDAPEPRRSRAGRRKRKEEAAEQTRERATGETAETTAPLPLWNDLSVSDRALSAAKTTAQWAAYPLAPLAGSGGEDPESRPLSDYQFPQNGSPMSDPRALAGGVLWKLLIVVGLVLGCARLWKRFGRFVPGVTATESTPQPQAHLQVCSTLALAPGKSLHLVAVGEERFILASSAQNITLIARLDGSATVPASAPTAAETEAPTENDWLATVAPRLFETAPRENSPTSVSGAIASWLTGAGAAEGPEPRPASAASLFQTAPRGKDERLV